MIKRRRSLSIKHGGRVKKINGNNGKMKILKTYCRFFQDRPKKCGMICEGFLDYPPCPDFETCWGKRKLSVSRTDSSLVHA
jgi:hypothetical protein